MVRTDFFLELAQSRDGGTTTRLSRSWTRNTCAASRAASGVARHGSAGLDVALDCWTTDLWAAQYRSCLLGHDPRGCPACDRLTSSGTSHESASSAANDSRH
jgi:hypothetical protein